MKRIIFYIFAIAAVCSLASCSSEEEGPAKLQLLYGQSPELSIPANHIGDQFSFSAADAWSAYISASARASEDVDWITLSKDRGPAGENVLSFNVEQNKTGKPRTAYIILVCQDETLAVQITQTNVDDPDWVDDQILFTQRIVENLNNIFEQSRIIDFDGNIYSYNAEGLVDAITGNLGKCTFTYSNFVHDDYQVIARETFRGRTWYIKLNDEGYASHIDAYDGSNTLTSSYDLEYVNGYLTKFIQYKHGDVYETSELKWEHGDVTQVVTTYDGGKVVSDYTYSNLNNLCGLMMFDTQLWVDMDNMEYFYYCGLLGHPTEFLISSSKSVEYEGGSSYNFSSTYQYAGDAYGNITKVVMTETEEGEGTSTSSSDFSWEQKY